MSYDPQKYRSALFDFRSARQRAALEEILARLTGKSNRLLSYEEVAQKLRLADRSDRGVRQIPLDKIVGSVGRYSDFTRSFLPLDDKDKERWARVKAATTGNGNPEMPPIEVYQVGDAYFVLDGNHRVSIARQTGMLAIDAHVIEVHSSVPLTADTNPDDLILKAEYAAFLEQIHSDRLLPAVDLSLTAPGQYLRLKEHIDVHRYFMGLDLKRDIDYDEAVLSWYEDVYLPVVAAIRERGLLRWFPKRTEADLYLWVSEYRVALEQELGWAIRPEAAATDLMVKESSRAESREVRPGAWREARLVDRYIEHLFMDILVPVSGTPESWQALDQAILVARHEKAELHGLHVVAAEEQKDGPEARAVLERFNAQCREAGVSGSLLIEAGEVASRICARALLTDLVVLNAAHPPAAGLARLGSGLRTVIGRCARPLLAVPAKTSSLDRALLAFDGSPKSKEALFVAAYLAEQWKTSLVVVALTGSGHLPASVLDYPRKYLELHEVQAEFVLENGPTERLYAILQERGLNLIVMGGYSASALEQMVVDSTVNVVLRESRFPVLICR